MTSMKYIIPDCKNPAKEDIKRMSDERVQPGTNSIIKCEDK